ncbi:MAG: biotin/lipoyl-containing protein, partial [Pseudomonadota bacterium]|nr:biotin/lipoyl-containing protein [Pseudomonadota bacterium]
MTIEKIAVPDLGEATDVEVIELLVTVGQQVAENDSLLVLESDKAAMEIPAPVAGVVKSIAINLGDTVSTGVEILSLEVECNGSPAESSDDAAKDETQEPLQIEVPPPGAASESGKLEKFASIEFVVTVPDLGTEDEVDVIEIHVSAGDKLEADQPLLTLESDKAAMEVPSPQAGEVLELLVKVGDKVKTGAEVLRLSAAAGGEVRPEQEVPHESIKATDKATDDLESLQASEPPQFSLPAAQNTSGSS